MLPTKKTHVTRTEWMFADPDEETGFNLYDVNNPLSVEELELMKKTYDENLATVKPVFSLLSQKSNFAVDEDFNRSYKGLVVNLYPRDPEKYLSFDYKEYLEDNAKLAAKQLGCEEKMAQEDAVVKNAILSQMEKNTAEYNAFMKEEAVYNLDQKTGITVIQPSPTKAKLIFDVSMDTDDMEQPDLDKEHYLTLINFDLCNKYEKQALNQFKSYLTHLKPEDVPMLKKKVKSVFRTDLIGMGYFANAENIMHKFYKVANFSFDFKQYTQAVKTRRKIEGKKQNELRLYQDEERSISSEANERFR